MQAAYAGLWARAKAFALDYLIIAGYLALIIAAGVGANIALPDLTQMIFTNRILGQVAGFLLVTLPVSLYFALFESSPWQATWGKRVLGLQVVGTNGERLRFPRALGRTLLKFIPWELAHTCIWQLQFAPEEPSPLIWVGFGLVWLLAGVYAAGLLMSSTRQTLYDRLAQTYVIDRRRDPAPI